MLKVFKLGLKPMKFGKFSIQAHLDVGLKTKKHTIVLLFYLSLTGAGLLLAQPPVQIRLDITKVISAIAVLFFVFLNPFKQV